jgi:hypothetical protein
VHRKSSFVVAAGCGCMLSEAVCGSTLQSSSGFVDCEQFTSALCS